MRIDPTGYFWDELGNLLSGKGWRESTEEEKAERRRNREQRSGLAGSSGQSSSSQNTSKPSKPKDELDELEEELNPGIPPDPVPELPKDGPTTSEEPNLGGNIYSVSYGIGGYVFVGGEVNVGFVMDDQGNYGVIFEVRAGTGVEVSLDIAKGLDEILSPGLSATSGNNETIYDLDGPTGMEASASFILNVTMDDKGNLSPNLSSIGFGGSLSWGYAKLIPVSDGVKWVGNKIKDYSNWLNENNYREPEMHVNNMKLITRADLFEMLNNYSSIPDDVMIPRR
ncbi:MAG: hypothetical protein GX085_00780 [Firmicutes bacterium]|nr:hypothetical protein [Bacillota bacterium]